MISSSYTSCALGWIGCVADRAVKSTTRETLESFSWIKVKTRNTGTSTIVRVEDKTSLTIAFNADWRILLDIETSSSWTGSRTASSFGVIGSSVLEKTKIGPQILIYGG